MARSRYHDQALRTAQCLVNSLRVSRWCVDIVGAVDEQHWCADLHSRSDGADVVYRKTTALFCDRTAKAEPVKK